MADLLIEESSPLYIPTHLVMLPALLMVWIGIMVTIATMGYGIIALIKKLFRGKK